jgi:hypothetical protein
MENLNKETVEKLIKKKGNVKGEAIKSHHDFIFSKEGEEGVKKVEEKMQEVGHSLDFSKITIHKMYPASLAILVVLSAREVFNWDEKIIKEWGMFNLKNSFILKGFLRYFVSPKMLVKILPTFWEKEYDFGLIEAEEIKDEKKIIIKVKDYDLHPVNCIAFIGMAEEIMKYVTRAKKVMVTETKCLYRGDEYHEYSVNWE